MNKIFKLICFILVLFFSLSLAYADLTTDNQAYYSFDDNNNSYDIFGATGTSQGMDFDGVDDYAETPHNTDLTINNGEEIFIDFDYKFSSTQTTTFFDKGNDLDVMNYGVVYFGSTNQLVFRYKGGGVTHDWRTTNTFTDTTSFHNVKVNYTFGDGSSIKFYVDDVLQSGSWESGNGNAIPQTNTHPLSYGSGFNSIGGRVNYFDGELTNLSILKDGTQIINNLFSPLNDLSGNNNFATGENGVTYTTNSKFGNGAMDFDGVNDYVSLGSFNPTGNSGKELSVFLWTNANDQSGSNMLISQFSTTTNERAWQFVTNGADGKLRVQITSDGGATLQKSIYTTNDVLDGTYKHVGFVWDNDKLNIYVDGVKQALSVNFNDTFTAIGTTTAEIQIGARENLNSNYWDGDIDEVAIYNKSLSQSEINELYNTGNPYDQPLGATITFNNPTQNQYLNNTNFTLNVSFSQVTNSTYTLNNGTETFLGNNTNESTKSLTGIEGLNTIQVFTNTSGTLTNETINITIDTNNPSLIVTLPTEYNSFDDFNISQYINVSDTNLDTCIVTISGESSTTCTNTSYNFATSGNKTINITATDLAGNTNTSLNNVMLINPLAYFQFEKTDTTSITGYTFNGRSDTNGTVSFNYYNDGLVIGSNNLTFEKLGFATTNIIFNLNTSSPSFNQTYTIQDSTIILTIYDRTTNTVLTGLSEVQLIASVGFNGSTTTGFLNITDINFLPEQYQMLVNHEDYATENIFFTYNNQELLPVDVYLLAINSTNFGITGVKVISSNGLFIKGATCSLMEWRPSLSSYVTVAQGITDVDGEVFFNVELDTHIYKALCSKGSDSKEQLLGNGGVISVSGLVAPIYLNEQDLALAYKFEDVLFNYFNTTVNETHQRLTFTWSDENGLVSKACIRQSRSTGLTKTQLTQTCTSSSSGEIQIITNINNTYNLVTQAILFDSDNIEQSVGQLTFESTENLEGVIAKYHLDLIIPILLFFLGVGLGLVLDPQNIYISLVALFILEWVTFAIVPTVISFTTVSFLSVILGFLIWGVYSGRR